MFSKESILSFFALIIAFGMVTQTASAQSSNEDVVRIGMIGLDTSHSPSFTETINDPDAEGLFAKYEVVAAYPKGSLVIESSYSRIPEYTEEVKEMGVEIVDSIDELLTQVDVVLLETNDGQRHLEQVLPVLKAGKPVFVDKPVAASLADAIRMYDAAEKYDVPMFSSSSLRWAEGVQSVVGGEIGDVIGADAYSPASLEPHHPDLYWYGIHGVELLYTAMGTGCETVVRMNTDGTDVVTCRWEDGRIGTFRGTREGSHSYGGTAFGTDGITQLGPYSGYEPMLREVMEFFETGEPPMSREETIEIYAFMEAADESKRLGGQPVTIKSVLDRARAHARTVPAEEAVEARADASEE